MQLKERGLTLVEVLLTLTLLSIVGLLIWSVFFQGVNFSSKAISTNQMQQELNVITTYVTRVHQTSDSYTIDIKNDQLIITSIKEGETSTQVFDHPSFIYGLTMDQIGEIHPNEKDVLLTITVSDKSDRKNLVSIETFLSRLKDGGGDDEEPTE